jgi:hypothetical protein
MEIIKVTILCPRVELVCENRYGKLYETSEGWHINGDKQKFIACVKRDLHSGDFIAEEHARYVLSLIKYYREI